MLNFIRPHPPVQKRLKETPGKKICAGIWASPTGPKIWWAPAAQTNSSRRLPPSTSAFPVREVQHQLQLAPPHQSISSNTSEPGLCWRQPTTKLFQREEAISYIYNIRLIWAGSDPTYISYYKSTYYFLGIDAGLLGE